MLPNHEFDMLIIDTVKYSAGSRAKTTFGRCNVLSITNPEDRQGMGGLGVKKSAINIFGGIGKDPPPVGKY